MGKKCGSGKKQVAEHPLHKELVALSEAYKNLLDAGCRAYTDVNLMGITVLGVHTSLGNMLLGSLTEIMDAAHRKSAEKRGTK